MFTFDTSNHYIGCAVVGLFFGGVGGVVRGCLAGGGGNDQEVFTGEVTFE